MVAALLVFLHHFYLVPQLARPDRAPGLIPAARYPYPAGTFWESFFIEGHIGVTVFFVLSGFLITVRYYGRIQRSKAGISDYIRKRIARIYPLYFVILALLVYQTEGKLSFRRYWLPNWTLSQGFFAEARFSGIPTAWSLTVEESFYLLAPLVFLTIMRFATENGDKFHFRWRAVAVVLAAWVTALLAVGFALYHLSTTTGLDEDFFGFMAGINLMQFNTIFGQFFNFAVGIAAALVFRKVGDSAWWQSGRGGTAAGLSLTSIIGILICMYLMNLAGGLEAGWIYNYVIGVLSAVLIFSLTCSQNIVAKALNFNLFVYMGRISYALYLLQFGILTQFVLAGLFNPTHALFVPVLYVVMNVISALFYEFVERPGRWLVLKITDPLVNRRRQPEVERVS